MAVAPAVLGHLQRQLEAIHDLAAPVDVASFLVDGQGLRELGREPRAPEEVLVVESEAEGEPLVELGLYLAPALFDRLRGRDPAGRSGLGLVTEELTSFTTLAEGVSHVLYLLYCADRGRRVSQLELEVQGEVDKFAAAALHLWGRQRRAAIPALWRRLFGVLRLRAGLSAEEGERYRQAHALGSRYARRLLERHVVPGQLGGLLRDLRETFRLAAGEKFRAMAA